MKGFSTTFDNKFWKCMVIYKIYHRNNLTIITNGVLFEYLAFHAVNHILAHYFSQFFVGKPTMSKLLIFRRIYVTCNRGKI